MKFTMPMGKIPGSPRGPAYREIIKRTLYAFTFKITFVFCDTKNAREIAVTGVKIITKEVPLGAYCLRS
jgi:hypothetical protein